MTNTGIIAGSESFDIGCRVETKYNFATNKKGWQWRNLNYNQLQDTYQHIVTHWSASWNANTTFNGMSSIGVSCHFLIDDDINDDGIATIYQTLDIQHVAFCQGKHKDGRSLNPVGISTEICYMPQYYENKNLYSSANIKKYNITDDHPVVKAPVHGTNLSVHTPSEAQYKALCSLYWGLNNLFPNITAQFPRDSKNNYLTTALSDPFKYTGFVDHRQLTKRKADCCALNFRRIETDVKEMLDVGYNIYRQIT